MKSSKSSGKISAKWVPIFSICSFFLGIMFTNKYVYCKNFNSLEFFGFIGISPLQNSWSINPNFYFRFWVPLESNNQLITQKRRDQELQIVSEDCNARKKVQSLPIDVWFNFSSFSLSFFPPLCFSIWFLFSIESRKSGHEYHEWGLQNPWSSYVSSIHF